MQYVDIDDFLNRNEEFCDPKNFRMEMMNGDNGTFIMLLKDRMAITFRPLMVELINKETHESEIYIPKSDFDHIAKDSRVFDISGIERSEKFKDLPFDPEFERKTCERLNIDHGQLNERLVKALDGRIGLKRDDILNELIALNIFCADLNFVTFEMKNI